MDGISKFAVEIERPPGGASKDDALVEGHRADKKEEFSGIMGYMGPENSFPQICVVSDGEFASVTF
jgi:hypothetical protein